MGNKGIGVKCVVLAVILIVILLLIDKGKLDFSGKGKNNFSQATCVELDPSSHQKFIEDNRVAFIAYTASWCGHCKRLMEPLDKLAGMYENDPAVGIAKLDADKHKEIGTKLGVQGFPTIKIYKNGKFVEDYRGERTASAVKQTIDKHKNN